MSAPTKSITKKKVALPLKKIRIPIVPAFGPTGCDAEQWAEYARHLRIHFESGGCEHTIPGGIQSWASTPYELLPDSKSRRRPLGYLMSALGHSNTRVVNIQEPWASMIAKGGRLTKVPKDFENRPDAFPQGGGWMVIVASKVNYSGPEWQARLDDIRRRLAWSGSSERIVFKQSDLARTEQHALGVAKVVSVNNWDGIQPASMKTSIWNNGDAHAWKITEVHELPVPVFYGNGSLGKPYFKNCSDVFKSQVKHQLSRVASPEEDVEAERVVMDLVNAVAEEGKE